MSRRRGGILQCRPCHGRGGARPGRVRAAELRDRPRDQERTVGPEAASALRDAYDNMLAPFERTRMPMLRNGAAAPDPRAKVWKRDRELLVGTFDLWLCNDPAPPCGASALSACGPKPGSCPHLGHFGFTPHHPRLNPERRGAVTRSRR